MVTNVKITESFKIPKEFRDELTIIETEHGFELQGPEHILDELMRRLPEFHTITMKLAGEEE